MGSDPDKMSVFFYKWNNRLDISALLGRVPEIGKATPGL